MSSIESKFLSFFLGVFNFKYFVERALKHPQRNKIKLRNAPEFRNYTLDELLVLGKSVITLTPNMCNSPEHILFFHGGAYVFEGSAMHRKLIVQFAKKAACKVSYIDYPLAPEYSFETTFKMVQSAFLTLQNKYPTDKFVFMGDSAGGGLALAFAQKLASENAIIQPKKLVLFSPWIDLKMDNPHIANLANRDKVLSLNGLQFAACAYAGGEDLSNNLLSPLFGNFENLGPTLVFYGTEEILLPDIELMKEKTNALSQFVFRKFDHMQHDWVILPITEANEALDMAVEFMNS